MRSAVVLLLAVVLGACDGGDDTASTTTVEVPLETSTVPAATAVPTTPPTSPTSIPTTPPPDAVVPEGFGTIAATATTADGTVCQLCLWLAATGDQRALGLMFATDLGGPDGMLFQYDAPTSSAFWMKNTLMPLSIAFYDAGGAYLDGFDMEPCAADPCAVYPTPADFVYAIEVPQGMLDELGMTPGSTLTLSDLPCGDA